MGILDIVKGMGGGDKAAAPVPHKSALEQAREAKDEGFIGNTATNLVENLLEVGIDGKGPFDSAAKVAADALKDKKGNVEEAVDKIVFDHLKVAAAGGFVTSVGGFITLPVAMPANVAGFYIIATRMVAAVAKLRGYDLKQQEIRTAILLSLVGADAKDLLAKAGMVTPAGRLSNLAAQKLPGPAMMMINKAVGFRLISTAGAKTLTRFGRAIPIAGGAIGAGLDGYLTKRIADHARAEFPTNKAAGPARPNSLSI
ncbi:MAG: EcsC family protein [Micrococcales bacterium]|nr:EcsC family protein [Micrococcales bacterium]